MYNYANDPYRQAMPHGGLERESAVSEFYPCRRMVPRGIFARSLRIVPKLLNPAPSEMKTVRSQGSHIPNGIFRQGEIFACSRLSNRRVLFTENYEERRFKEVIGRRINHCHLIPDPKRRAILGARFAAIVEACSRDVGVAEPLLNRGDIRLVRKRICGGGGT
jgi:hypothetical protein